jgi:kinesin family protein 2/24
MSMLLAYGQTGSGKTFTVTRLEKLVVEKLMDGKLSGKWDIHMCIFEIAGSNMYGMSQIDRHSTTPASSQILTIDLLSDRKQISVLEDPFGAMQIVGVLEKNPSTSEEFLDLIDAAKEFRSTESTTKNDQSSRSHAICRIRVINKESPNSPEGSFLLVDLAGSEASADTQHHSRERMAETREINKSLTILKDCIRARALWSISRGEGTQKHVHIPFRSSKLTQVLKSAFDINNTQTCKTIVIACINPSILDVAHSKNTLRYAEMLNVPVKKAKPRPYDERIPTTWGNNHVQEWIKKNVRYFVFFNKFNDTDSRSQENPHSTLCCWHPERTVSNSADSRKTNSLVVHYLHRERSPSKPNFSITNFGLCILTPEFCSMALFLQLR